MNIYKIVIHHTDGEIEEEVEIGEKATLLEVGIIKSENEDAQVSVFDMDGVLVYAR